MSPYHPTTQLYTDPYNPTQRYALFLIILRSSMSYYPLSSLDTLRPLLHPLGSHPTCLLCPCDYVWYCVIRMLLCIVAVLRDSYGAMHCTVLTERMVLCCRICSMR